MTLTESISSCFSKYVTFSGRASRSEYWFWALFLVLVDIAIYFGSLVLFGAAGAAMGGDEYGAAGGLMVGLGSAIILFAIFWLVIFLPTLAVTVRRLHDSNKSAWFLLMYLIPVIGPLVIFIFTLLPSTPGNNDYGPQSA